MKVGVVGAGVFGRNHLRVVSQSTDAELAAVYDIDTARAEAAAKEFGCPAASDLEGLLAQTDAVIVAAPTTAHCEITIAALKAGRDVLVEKPLAFSPSEGKSMVDCAAQNGRILQVGHLERFNPAVAAAEKIATRPLFFEIHRLSIFTPRSLDVDVVFDLMIHDLDIVLSMVGRPPEEVRAAGISILSPKVDIANVRLAFPGGCVANLTASRVSTEKVRKLRFFQPGQYVSVDYTRQDMVAISVDEKRQISILPSGVQKGEPLQLQFASFVECIRTRQKPKVDGAVGLRALEAATLILDKIEEHAAIVAQPFTR